MALRDDLKTALRHELTACGVVYPESLSQTLVIERLLDEIEPIVRSHLSMMKVVEASKGESISADPRGADRAARAVPPPAPGRLIGKIAENFRPEDH